MTPLSPEAADAPSVPTESVTLAARFHTTSDVLQTEEVGDGQVRSKMTIALVPQKNQAELEKQGVVFPEIEEVRSNEGLSPEGRLELVPVDGTGNPATTHILQTLEVDKSQLVKDAQGHALIDDYTAALVPEGGSILAKGWFGVPDGTQVAPQGYEFKLGTSKAGAKTEARRLRLNRISDGLGNFSQSSLAGIINIPYVSAVAPLVALATAGPTLNKGLEDLKEAQDVLGYVEDRKALSKSDKITLEVGVGQEIPVSAEAETKRLETKVRMAKSKLASTGLLFAAGGSSVVGYAAAGGMFGAGSVAAALTGAVAATPYLAGAAMIVGSSGMVLNSLAELKSLSKEKSELLALQAKGETHVLKTIERVDSSLRRPVAVGEQQVPITERLKIIGKEQRKHQLLATAMGGGIASIAGTVGLGVGAMTMAGVAMAPAGVLASAQSVSRLRELAKEKKELVRLHDAGETMVPRQLERADGSWGEEKVPISTLLSDISKKQKTHSLILTAVGSTAGVLGLTVGAGLSFFPAGLLLLVPAAVGAALFPDKVKEFAQKVTGMISGRFGEDARTRKDLMRSAETEMESARKDLVALLDPLAQQDPSLFYTPSKSELKAAAKEGRQPKVGYFSQLNSLMGDYASARSRTERFQAMQAMDKLLNEAPESAKEYISSVKERLSDLQMTTEAGWVALEVTQAMRDPSAKATLSDDRVSKRISELGLKTDDLEGQLKDCLTTEREPKTIAAREEKIRRGDEGALRLAQRDRVFGAGLVYHQAQQEIGGELLGSLLDSASRGDKGGEAMELTLKEINHRLGRPMTPSTAEEDHEGWWLDPSTLSKGPKEPLRLEDLQRVIDSASLLDTPISAEELNASTAGLVGSTGPSLLSAPEQRMTMAFRTLHEIDAKAATRLGKAFGVLNSPEEFEGLSQEQIQSKRMEASLELTRAKEDLQKVAPEALTLWDEARVEVEDQYFQRSLDPDFVNKVLAEPSLDAVAKRLEISADQVKALFIGLLKSQITGDQVALQKELLDASGKDLDPVKTELLQQIDSSMTKVATAATGGGHDAGLAEVPLGSPTEDPSVMAFLKENPVVTGVLESPQLDAIAKELQTSPREVREAYLTLVQANRHPVLTAEFEGKLQAGDIKAARIFDIGSRVGQLVQAATRPSAAEVAQQVQAAMAGPVVKAVLDRLDIKALASELKLDVAQSLHGLLMADLSGDPTALNAVSVRAQGGDEAAKGELRLIQALAQGLQDEAARVQALGAAERIAA